MKVHFATSSCINLVLIYSLLVSLIVICHGIPDQRPLVDGDIINIDISCFKNGFHGDANATYTVGNVDEAGKKLIQVTRECLEKAIAMGKFMLYFLYFSRVN